MMVRRAGIYCYPKDALLLTVAGRGFHHPFQSRGPTISLGIAWFEVSNSVSAQSL